MRGYINAFDVVVVFSILSLALALDHQPLEDPTLDPHHQSAKSYSGYKVIRADVPLAQVPMIEALEESLDVEVTARIPKGRMLTIDVLAAPEAESKVLQVLKYFDMEYEEIIHDLQDMIQEEIYEEIENFDLRSQHQMTWDNYHSFEVMHKYLQYLEEQYPHLITLIEIGKSSENRSLVVAQVSSGTNQPAIWIDGGLHAREWVSPTTALYIIRQLVEKYEQNEAMVTMFDWYILPIANPDGYEYTRHYDRMWRKTRSKHFGENSRCVGVDPNRNFEFKWLQGGSSSYPCSDVYAGPYASSEPETVAISEFLMERKDQLMVYLSFHSYTQVWLMPWAYISDLPKNLHDLEEVANASATAMKKHNNTEFTVGTVTKLMYKASGSSVDYAYGPVGIPFAYAIELRDLGQYGFLLPKNQILPTAVETFDGMKVLAREVYKKLPKYRKHSSSNAELITSEETTELGTASDETSPS
ncbi:hypothetical protein SK128_001113 [Halocaridina rubra]|uniref:Peptidase M14 domain-containing protein n=1 Tax=Halocaridina rubra TaxID=373956 RepID=A0AAN8WLX9_HALRR